MKTQFTNALATAQEIINNGSAWVSIENIDIVKGILSGFAPVHGGAISDDCKMMVLYI